MLLFASRWLAYIINTAASPITHTTDGIVSRCDRRCLAHKIRILKPTPVVRLTEYLCAISVGPYRLLNSLNVGLNALRKQVRIYGHCVHTDSPVHVKIRNTDINFCETSMARSFGPNNSANG